MRLALIAILLSPVHLIAQILTHQEIDQLSRQQLPIAVDELRTFLRIKNNSHDSIQIKNNLIWCKQALEKRKFQVRELRLDRVPHLLGTRIINPKYPTVLVYMQIDGQPADGLEWDQQNPYEPVLKHLVNGQWTQDEWTSPYSLDSRIFARSASDSKGPALAFLTALDIADRLKVKPTFNIKIIMDFQEELGSPKLPVLVKEHQEKFSSKMVLIMDGARHVSGLPTLNFGARGIVTMQLKVFGPSNELHSGQYGNYAPNPVFKLARLLAGMKDENGRVLIPGFYQGISIDSAERKFINQFPADDQALNKRLGIAAPEQVAATYEEALQYPSLNVRGLKAGSVEEDVRTIIPSKALAEIDIRLVPETDGLDMVNLIREYIQKQGFHEVKGEPSDEERMHYTNLFSLSYRLGSKPFRTNINSPEGIWLDQAMQRGLGLGNYVKQRTTGGSQPIETFITTLNIPAVSIRFPNADNNIHAANENLTIGCYLEGIKMCLAILTQKVPNTWK